MSSANIEMLKRDALAPTLWRTCRVLANRQRLRILQELIRCPGQTVTQVSTRLRIPMSMTSQCLRALNARSLLEAGRVGKNVFYGPYSGVSVGGSGYLLRAIKTSFAKEKKPIEKIFRLATAFTHPRRIAIAKALDGGKLSGSELRERTAIRRRALDRHMKKLADRSFIERDGTKWRLARLDGALARTLCALACRN